MERISIQNIVEWTGGTLVSGDSSLSVEGLSTDSRVDCAGSLFVPLKGDNFDGHDFIPAAVGNGAVAIISEKRNLSLPSGVALVHVADTLSAFQSIAATYRSRFNIRSVAVTGSNGKTTTKEFIRAISSSKYRTTATEGTKNNHVGLPQTLLKLDSSTEVGVFEMGMSAPGEIRGLARLARPDVAVITNVCPVHTEFFKSIEEIAEAKSELLEVLGDSGIAILNADDKWFGFLSRRSKSPVTSFGMRHESDIRGSNVRSEGDSLVFDVSGPHGESARCRLHASGTHNAYNALAAVAVGMALGISLEDACSALAAACPPGMRFESHSIDGITVINDAYNANPVSTVSSLETFDAIAAQGRRIAVLGDMLELGWYSSEGHRSVGTRVASSRCDVLVTVGNLASGIAEQAREDGFSGAIYEFASPDEAAEFLSGFLTRGDILLLKASRALKLERIIERLEDTRNDGKHKTCGMN